MNSKVTVLEGDYIDGGSGDPDLDEAFAKFRDDLAEGEGSEGTISAYKLPIDKDGHTIAKSAKQAFLFSMVMGTASLLDIIDRIKANYMREGELSCVVRLTGHRPGRRGNDFNKVIRIEKENEQPKAAPQPGQTDVAGLFRAMQDMMNMQQSRADALMQRILEMQLRPTPAAAPPQNSDPMAFVERLMLMQAGMQRMSQMFAPAALPAPGAVVDPFEQVTRTLQMMKAVQSFGNPGAAPAGGEGEGDMLGNLTKLAAPFLGLMTETEKTKRAMIARGVVPGARRAPRPGANGSGAGAPGAGNGAPIEGTATAAADADTDSETATEGDGMSITYFREQLKTLCEMAAEGASAGDAANLILEQTPEEYDEALGELVSDENASGFAAKIGLLFSGCKAHAAWFEELRVHLNAAYDDPDGAAH